MPLKAILVRIVNISWEAAVLRHKMFSICWVILCVLLPICGKAQNTSLPDSAAPHIHHISQKAPPLRTPQLEVSSNSINTLYINPVWQPLRQRLAADGLNNRHVDALLATLPERPTQSPMGRKMRELYLRKFFPKPLPKGRRLYYKGVVNKSNADTCRRFVATNSQAFTLAEKRYGVPASIAVALLFVETRLGAVLGDVPENAFYTLASMSICRSMEDITEWLPRMPKHELHADWFATTMPKRADWAYQETKALIQYMIRDRILPDQLPGSIYGAVGLCQFMPSNIAVYGIDGNGDNRIDLFELNDAVASLANYLARHGWKPGLSQEQQHKILMTYNHAAIYANTILALADAVDGKTLPVNAQDQKGNDSKKSKQPARK